MSDVSAKDGSQETLVALSGMLFGAVLVSRLSHMHERWTWLTFFFFTALHLYANYR